VRAVVVAGALAVAVLAPGCGGDDVSNRGATGDLPAPSSVASTLVPRVEPPGPTAKTVKVWGPGGVKQTLDALHRAAGGRLLMTQAVLYPEYAIVQARQPAHPENVDRFVFRGGNVDGPSPVMIVGNENLDAKTFTREQVAFGSVKRLVRDAPTRLGIDGARTTHVIVERDTVFAAGQIVVRVYAGTARRSGYVEYDANGRFRRVVQ
jgi:hypothetical protein